MQKYANLVELEKCCQTHIFLQNFVLIQPRTSPLKICKNLPILSNFADPNPNPVNPKPAARSRSADRPLAAELHDRLAHGLLADDAAEDRVVRVDEGASL